MTLLTRALSATAAGLPLREIDLERRVATGRDVEIEILHCGICHSDLHNVRDEWGRTSFPLVPGHEIVGRVTATGDQVTRHAIGDLVGVGCMVDSCQECGSCDRGLENFCENGMTLTYGGVAQGTGEKTSGGYSGAITVDERFVLRLTEGVDPAGTAPLLCAGVTMFSPLRYHGVGEGTEVGIVGLGGLGHIGVKIAAAMGAEVTVLTTSPEKGPEAREFGATRVVDVRDADSLADLAGRLDVILDTSSATHDLDRYLELLHPEGTLVLLGIPPEPHESPNVRLLLHRRNLTGSFMGGIPETQEMLDFCAEHGIVSEVEEVTPDEVDAAFDRLARGDVRYRFVIDTSSLRRRDGRAAPSHSEVPLAEPAHPSPNLLGERVDTRPALPQAGRSSPTRC